MEKLKEMVDLKAIATRPADTRSIQKLEQKIGVSLSGEYKSYLSTFGVITFEGNEIYGLGVPDDYYLNVLDCRAYLSRDPTFPRDAVPLLEVGDGQYYLYDNSTQKVLLWAMPNGGIVRVLEEGLEEFLIEHLFQR